MSFGALREIGPSRGPGAMFGRDSPDRN
jgi:hypothetical protein